MKLSKLTPNLEVTDIKKTVDFYINNFGFSFVMLVPTTQDGIEQEFAEGKDYVYALIKKDNVELMFQRTDSFKKDIPLSASKSIGASASFYMEIEGIDDFHQEVKKNDLNPTELKIAWYGMKEFYLTDNNGYILGFGENQGR